MCLILIASKSHPVYPLIIAANRDEFYHRPTAPLSFWDDHPEILAGRDLQGKGTWLGVTKKGRIAAVTNYRDPEKINPNAPSRGLLVSNFLISDQPPADYLNAIENLNENYNGFNLVVGDSKQLWWYSNRKNNILKIGTGIHGISNHLLDTPWPKIKKSTSGLHDILNTSDPIDPEDIFQLLADTNRPADKNLPDTGVGLEWERILSSVFVTSEIYGTRSSAVILLDTTGNLLFLERTYKTGAHTPTAVETRRYGIKL
jgi:uncharacterized protein with NRDE domain